MWVGLRGEKNKPENQQRKYSTINMMKNTGGVLFYLNEAEVTRCSGLDLFLIYWIT